MAVFFWYLVKSDFFSVHYCKHVHWTSHLFQVTKKGRPCLTGHPVCKGSEIADRSYMDRPRIGSGRNGRLVYLNNDLLLIREAVKKFFFFFFFNGRAIKALTPPPNLELYCRRNFEPSKKKVLKIQMTHLYQIHVPENIINAPEKRF